MEAPDSHWILLKREWLPIEFLLNQLVPDAENSRDRINRLSGSLDAQCIRNLHVLRVQRNRVLHHDQALNHSMHWAATARRMRNDLESLLRARSMVSRLREPMAARAAWPSRQPLRRRPLPTLSHATDVEPVNRQRQVAHADASAVSAPPERRFAMMGVLLTGVSWCGGSWLLQPLLQHAITLVNIYSVVWWLLQLGWLMCWPGIAVAHLVNGLCAVAWWLATILFSGVSWLVAYVIAHPY